VYLAVTHPKIHFALPRVLSGIAFMAQPNGESPTETGALFINTNCLCLTYTPSHPCSPPPGIAQEAADSVTFPENRAKAIHHLTQTPDAQGTADLTSFASYNTTQHNTTQHNTTQHNTTQHNTTQHNTTQHNTTQRTRFSLSIAQSPTVWPSCCLIRLSPWPFCGALCHRFSVCPVFRNGPSA
jgi:cell division septation protein DedD